MKKVLFLLFVSICTQANAQKITPDSFTVDKGIATVYLSNGSVENIQVLINPGGSVPNGKLQNRQGLMLTPPFKPGLWEKNVGETPGQHIVGFQKGQGFRYIGGNLAGQIYIIEGLYDATTKSTRYFGRFKECIFVDSPEPIDWVTQYEEGSYVLPNFVQTVNISKDANGSYFVQ
jgi:hypothetical protein